VLLHLGQDLVGGSLARGRIGLARHGEGVDQSLEAGGVLLRERVGYLCGSCSIATMS
jgi:hypothetical protein